MTVPTRLFAPDREELFDLDAWIRYAPRERGVAEVWMTTGGPAIPQELVDALGLPAEEVRARPGHPTGDHTHDVFACLRQGGKTHFVAGIEAATGDGFGPTVAEEGGDELAQALFGRPVDDTLKTQPRRLWAAAVATIVEAQQRGVPACALVIHQLRGDDDVSAFAAAVQAAGGVSHATDQVAAGTRIRVLSVRR